MRATQGQRGNCFIRVTLPEADQRVQRWEHSIDRGGKPPMAVEEMAAKRATS